MATTKKLQIVIDAINDADDELKELKKQLGGVDDGAKQADKGLKGMMSGLSASKAAIMGVVGGAVAFGVAAKKAFDLGKEGAELEFIQGKFENLSVAIGTTSDVLLNDLREATDGLVSDSELVASATGFMELGLVKTREEAVRLTRVAGQLGMDMNQLTLTLTNQTTMRFDALGVSVDGFKERVDELKKSGMSAEEAFNEAFLQQAEQQIELVGDRANSSAAAFDRLDTAAENASDRLKRQLAPAAESVANALADLIDANIQNADATSALNDAEARGIITMSEYRDIVARMAGHQLSASEAIEIVNSKVAENTFLTAQNIIQNEINAAMMSDAAKAAEELADAQSDVSQQMSELQLFMSGPLKKENEKYQDQVESLNEKAADLTAEIDELSGMPWRTAAQEEQLAGLQTDLMEVNQQIVESGNVHDESTKKILFNILNQRLAIDGLTEAEADALVATANSWGLVDDATKKAYDIASQYSQALVDGKINADDFADAINGIPNQKVVRITTNFSNDWDRFSGGPGMFSGRAAGGPVSANTPYIVGESGPELFVPNAGGTIVPNDVTSRMGGTNINITYAPGISLGTEREFTSKLKPLVMQAVRDAKQRGGYPV